MLFEIAVKNAAYASVSVVLYMTCRGLV